MSNEAPKKVWIGKSHGYWQTESVFELDVAYIRADIVYDLIKALIAIGAGQGDPKEIAIQALENHRDRTSHFV